MTDDVTQLIELGSQLAFDEVADPRSPDEGLAAKVVTGALPLCALPVIASISAIAGPKDYALRRVKAAAAALRSTAVGDDVAVIEVVALTIGKQLFSSATLDDERELLSAFRDRGTRFRATAAAFDALGAGDDEALALLRAGVDETRSPSLAWLEEACARMRRDRRRTRELRALIGGPDVVVAREHIGDDLPPWDARQRTPTSMHGFMHCVLVAYRRLRGREVLREWLPILARATSRGSA